MDTSQKHMKIYQIRDVDTLREEKTKQTFFIRLKLKSQTIGLISWPNYVD